MIKVNLAVIETCRPVIAKVVFRYKVLPHLQDLILVRIKQVLFIYTFVFAHHFYTLDDG